MRTMNLSWMHLIQLVQKLRRRERERAKAAKAASAPDASIVMLKTKQDQLSYLLEATVRIDKGLATLTQNQESLERIIETKFHDLDVKVTEIQTTVEKLQEEVEDRSDRPTTDAFQRVPRAQRSAAMPVVGDTRTTIFAPAATASVIPPVSTPPAPQTSAEAFADGLVSTPSTHTGATSQKTTSGAPGARA